MQQLMMTSKASSDPIKNTFTLVSRGGQGIIKEHYYGPIMATATESMF